MTYQAPHQFVRNGVLYGCDAAVAAMVRALCGMIGGWDRFVALGVVLDQQLVGGVVFHNYRPEAGDIEISAGFTTPAWCRPGTLREILRYPVVQLGCRRCTAYADAENETARRFLERLGFVEEGRLRRAYDGETDRICYGVLREELRLRRVA